MEISFIKFIVQRKLFKLMQHGGLTAREYRAAVCCKILTCIKLQTRAEE
jgi:hypothetical protein